MMYGMDIYEEVERNARLHPEVPPHIWEAVRVVKEYLSRRKKEKLREEDANDYSKAEWLE